MGKPTNMLLIDHSLTMPLSELDQIEMGPHGKHQLSIKKKISKSVHAVEGSEQSVSGAGALPRRRNRARARRPDGAATGVYHRDERKRAITVTARCTLRDTTHTRTRIEPDTP
ncbi:hypothetical protein EVAR_74441_1 [Eumeta japonica]|uniref:Uncharacterized protein n=1 Tax=Eumeta variegata TaxID=151549 RepID=A0A4C1YNA7_EUMVA|nr:hypothetical protein EVAR_74441_1 [Eumeta japonica]